MYNLAISLYTWGIWIASFFNKKAKLWVNGRKNIWTDLAQNIEPTEHLIWIHCASLGEFEQGRPLIEHLKQTQKCKILLTFFSPSGYEIRKNYAHADYIFYLPADTKANALRFLDIVQAQLVIFVKYEFWYNYLTTCFERQIPTILISAVFRENQLFFQPYGKKMKRLLETYTHIFVQNEDSQKLLNRHGIHQVSVVGDTRIDRVLQIAQNAPTFPLIAAFAKGQKILIAGSTWQADEAILNHFINNNKLENWKIIIAPHEIKESNIQRLEQQLFMPSLRYSNANEQNIQSAKILIINNIGMLSALYQYGTIAYIGGGFGAGIHNTLEPIAFGLPVLFGPKYQKFMEAVQLVAVAGAFSIQNENDLEHIFKQLAQKDFYIQASQTAKNYLIKNKGATKQIMDFISKY